MTIWTPDLGPRQGPRYRAIADALAADVAAGRLKPGDRLPTHRELAWRLGVTVGTVSRAYGEAARRGLLNGEVGRGTFVRSDRQAQPPGFEGRPEAPCGPVPLDFILPPPVAETREIATALRDLADDPGLASVFAYQSHAGRDVHRRAAALWISREDFPVTEERVVLTSGAHHAIVAVLAAVTRPGDRVLVEALTYPNLRAVAGLLGLRLTAVEIDEHGLVPEALEGALRSTEARALYCIPTLHNPTTASLPEERRRAIAEIAMRHDLPVIEDDIFGRLPEQPAIPLSRLAPRHGFYLTSLSKTLAPGLRVGFVAAPAEAVGQVVDAVRASCWTTSPLTAEIAARWITSGAAAEILSRRRREAAARRRSALDILGRWDVACPPGSQHLWLGLPEPWRAADFVAEAGRHDVLVTGSDAFAVSRAGGPPAVRVCLGGPPDCGHLEEGLRRLAAVLSGPPAAGSPTM